MAMSQEELLDEAAGLRPPSIETIRDELLAMRGEVRAELVKLVRRELADVMRELHPSPSPAADEGLVPNGSVVVKLNGEHKEVRLTTTGKQLRTCLGIPENEVLVVRLRTKPERWESVEGVESIYPPGLELGTEPRDDT